MKKLLFVIILFILSIQISMAQDSVTVTFRHYPTQDNVVRAFVPGTFNNWGPNSSGRISPDAPSLMTYVDSLGFFVKSYKFQVGQTVQYKFHEHYDQSGSSWQWFTDPLNPQVNTSDNNNSMLTIDNVMIFEISPKDGTVITDPQVNITAGIFITYTDSILLDQSSILVDDVFASTFENSFITELSILNFTLSGLENGNHKVVIQLMSKNSEAESDSITFTYQGADPPIEPLPQGMVDGINYIDDATTVTLVLYAPYYKDFVYVIGDFNDWQVDENYFMKRTPDLQRYWLTITGLQPGKKYGFQYFVDGEIRLADAYTKMVLDPWNDSYISDATYPGLMEYPTGKTSEIVSVFQTAETPYEWEVPDFQRPASKDLVIYELLIRDFLENHDYQTLADTLSYFEKLGINAIELMPINEFEGNISWGYNPSFYFAPDKYYGPSTHLKRFIDECHKRGIAVILDMVFNHSYGQSPMVRLFAEGNYGPPSSKNPYYNPDYDPDYPGYQARHPYSVGYDFNHEKFATKEFIDRVNKYWITEYNVDGFRFDLTKGLTQRVSYMGNGNYNEGLASQYDPSRIAILKRMADEIWSVDSTVYVILEHFADNSEETELANYGALLWGNLNSAYSQSAMGWLEDNQRQSGLAWGNFRQRGWNKPGLVTYMESHDEPWLMYNNLQYGRSEGNYNIKELRTALNRIKLCAAFFLTLPGPKMMWQFGELGYDQALPENGRTDPKPILWNYYNRPERKSLFETYAALIKLRNEHALFRDPDATVQFRIGHGIYDRRINISNDTMNVTIIGNFDVSLRDVNPNFQKTGWWYDYFTNDSINVTDTQEAISLYPGEFHIFSDIRLKKPKFTTGINSIRNNQAVKQFTLDQNYPNPFNPETTIRYYLPQNEFVMLEIYNIQGQKIKTLVNAKQTAGQHRIRWNGLTDSGLKTASGVYFYKLSAGEFMAIKKMILLR